jgi:hypothetical protein
VSELLEAGNYAEAKTALEDLAAGMDTSIAKDRTLVIQMRAQIDDMLDTVNGYTSYAYNPMMPAGLMPVGLPNLSWGSPPMPGGPLQRQMAVSSSYGGIPPPPALAPVLSRLASNTATLGMQRGLLSGGSANPAVLGPTFSSPVQRQASDGLTQQYLHEPYDPDSVHAAPIVPLGVLLVGTPIATPTASPILTAAPLPRSNLPVTPTNL